MRGGVSVKGLALMSTELKKLRAQRAHEHVSSACVQHIHTHFAKRMGKNPQTTLPACHCRVQPGAGGSS